MFNVIKYPSLTALNGSIISDDTSESLFLEYLESLGVGNEVVAERVRPRTIELGLGFMFLFPAAWV